ncbi:MAG TPA: 2-phospho-L-lactate guanylyltransferase [Actinobacteria bacterium]|nr:2-phospho-L-lactate guanylyltransferase [Actinomycetota bacterium]
MPWCVLLPVKRLASAKSRLNLDLPGFTGQGRAELALALARDTCAAALAAPRAAHVLAITDDAVATASLSEAGAVVIADLPEAGINAALLHGFNEAQRRWPGIGVAAMSCDLAAATPEAIDQVLAETEGLDIGVAGFVADAQGTGTTMYLAPHSAPFAPSFGPHSRALHAAGGAIELGRGAGLASLRRDIDTAVDLWDAQRLGVGQYTRAVLDALAHP